MNNRNEYLFAVGTILFAFTVEKIFHRHTKTGMALMLAPTLVMYFTPSLVHYVEGCYQYMFISSFIRVLMILTD